MLETGICDWTRAANVSPAQPSSLSLSACKHLEGGTGWPCSWGFWCILDGESFSFSKITRNVRNSLHKECAVSDMKVPSCAHLVGRVLLVLHLFQLRAQLLAALLTARERRLQGRQALAADAHARPRTPPEGGRSSWSH
jgi:hypothetical protein